MLLVTGGAGFIGSNLVAALTARGERVVVCDRLGQDDKWRNIAKRPLENLIAPESLDDCLGDCAGQLSAVIHMGAISATTESDADALASNNFGLSRKLWTWCSEKKVPLIYASSAATYGDGTQGFDDALDESYQATLRPLNGYGWSKLLFDRWVAAHCDDAATRPPFWAGLKFFNVYGPNEYHKGTQASVAYHLFQQITGGKPARLFQSHNPDYPDGGQLRDFVWIGDCVAVVLWLLDTASINGLFNVGTGKARSFADLARAIFKTMGQDQNIQYVPTPEAIRERYQYFTEARMERLRKAGYNDAFASLENGVERYLRDYLMTDDPYL